MFCNASFITRFDIECIQHTCADMVARLGGAPDWLFITARENQAYDMLTEQLIASFPDVHIHGLTSSQGMMSERGLHTQIDDIGIWAIRDTEGAFGVGFVEFDDSQDIMHATQNALHKALSTAQRPGEYPPFVFMSTPPGYEEKVLDGLCELLGEHVMVMGGSAADDHINDKWRLFDRSHVLKDAVIISVLFPSVNVVNMFEGGYEPTAHQGTVTRSEGRALQEIDGLPAAAVYDTWTQGLISSIRQQGGGSLLHLSSSAPLGRLIEDREGLSHFTISQPNRVDKHDAIYLFTDVIQGDVVTLMSGGQEALISRASRLVLAASDMNGDHSPDRLRGILMTFCVGCLMHLDGSMHEVLAKICAVAPDVPFLGAVTFGEQGRVAGQKVGHGNLMISMVAFYDIH